MKRQRKREDARRGAIVPLAAVLMVALLGMVAFAVDTGYVVLVKQDMQNAADSAALAGASQLLAPRMTYNPSVSAQSKTAVAAAVTEAKRFSAKNAAGGRNLALRDQDATVGYMADPLGGAAAAPWSLGMPFPNVVQVTIRRDSVANGSVSLFFARVFGVSSWNGQVSATACASRGYNITGFKSAWGGANGGLLPIAIDLNYWNTFMATGKSPDGTVHDGYAVIRPSSDDPPPGNVTARADDIPEFNDVYPNKTSPGNFGLVCIGPPASDTPTFRNWIDNGPSPADLAYFGADGLQASSTKPATLKGGPGLKSTLQSNLANAVGKPRVIPLFSSYSGNGNNTTYTIVGFAGVAIVEASGHGNNMQVVVQPAVVIDPTATYSSTTWSGSASNIYPASPLALIR